MQYCTRCLYPANHPLGITFDEKGLCSGCCVHEEKDFLNWKEREESLRCILSDYRSRTGKNFDCVVPVSGARDSYFIVHIIKHVFKMNPLIVSFNKEYNTKMGIRNLAYLRTIFDCDFMSQNLSPELLKKIAKCSLEKLGSLYWHCLAGQTVFPVQVAVKFRIPLIVWGVHQGVDQVGMFSHLDDVEMMRSYRKNHDLMGLEAEDLLKSCEELDESMMLPFTYPSDDEIESVGVRGIYLGNYIRWDSKLQHEQMISQYGYETAHQQRTFNMYDDVDCFHYSGLHDYIKFLKFGYGKVSDHASREIRLKRMTREQGIEFVTIYQERYPRDLKLFLDWIGLSEGQLFSWVDKHRDPNIWARNDSGHWELKDSVVDHSNDEGINEVRLEIKENCNFSLSDSRDPRAIENQHVVVARGFVDSQEPQGA